MTLGNDIELYYLDDNFDMYDLFMKLDDKLVKSTYNNSKEWFIRSIQEIGRKEGLLLEVEEKTTD